MKKLLHISPDIGLPLDSVTQTFAILAKRRVGKTYTASVMAEEMAKAGLPFVVLDPTGAWWGLRSSADGKSEGLPVVIIGGLHGDLPLDAASGKVIAELVVEHPGFYVIDLSDTESDAAQDRFATAFAQRLYRLKDKHREPLHLFIDEADSFAPQRPLEGQKVMLGAFEALVRRGGIRGIGMTLITQRPAVLNKNVLTQCEVIIALQTTSPQDQDAVDDWVKRNGTDEQRRDLMSSLASLKQGEAWFYSPAWLEEFRRIHVRRRETFNSSATPKVGERSVTPQKLAAVDLEQLRGKIADSIEKAKANDPAELKRRVAELERELRSARKEAPPAGPEIVEVPVITDAQIEALRVIGGEWRTKCDALDLTLRTVRNALDLVEAARRVPAAVPATTSRTPLDSSARDFATRAALAAERVQAARVGRAILGDEALRALAGEALTGPQQRILDTLRSFEALGQRSMKRPNLAAFVGYAASTKAFKNALSWLHTAGHINYEGAGQVSLTADGRALSKPSAAPPDLDELHRAWKERLSGPQRTMMDLLIAAYPSPVSREVLAGECNYALSTKAFKNGLSGIRSLGLIEYAGTGNVVATEMLFPEGLR